MNSLPPYRFCDTSSDPTGNGPSSVHMTHVTLDADKAKYTAFTHIFTSAATVGEGPKAVGSTGASRRCFRKRQVVKPRRGGVGEYFKSIIRKLRATKKRPTVVGITAGLRVLRRTRSRQLILVCSGDAPGRSRSRHASSRTLGYPRGR